MAKPTLQEISGILNDSTDKKDVHAYGKVVDVVTRTIGHDKITGEERKRQFYKVSIAGAVEEVECARLIGAAIGDTVMVMTMANGYSVVTGRVGGDKDSMDVRDHTEQAINLVNSAISTINNKLITVESVTNTIIQLAETAGKTTQQILSAWEMASELVDDMQQAATEAGTALDQIVKDADSAAKTLGEMEAAATAAQTTLTDIYEDASEAKTAATEARTYATSALLDLADIENVIGALEWIEKHGQYVPTADPEVIYGKFYFYPTFVQASEIKPDTRYYTLEVSPVADPTKMYLYYEANATGYSPTTDTDPVSGKQYYRIIATKVDTPSQGSLSSYYEISEYTNVVFPEGNNSYEIYTHTEDTEIVDGKNYFTVEATQVVNLDADDLYLYYVLDNGVYVKADQITQGVTYYTLEGTMVDEPDIADIDEYYEQTIDSQPIVNPSEAGAYELSEVDKTIGDYIRTHLALTDEGLMIFNDDDSGRIVLSESGMEVRDKKNRVVATYGADTVIGNTKEGYYILITDTKLSFMQATPDDNPATDIEVAHISGERLTIPHAVIVNSMGVGDPTLGAWQWVITNNQHLTLKWIKEGD